MSILSARQYDAHYRRLGLRPGSNIAEISAAANSLRAKFHPDRLNAGPLQATASFRLSEIAHSEMLLLDYWQLHKAPPPSIQSRYCFFPPNQQIQLDSSSVKDIDTPRSDYKPEDPSQLSILTVAPVEVSAGLPASAQASDETEITLASPLIGPVEPNLSFTYSLFRTVDGSVSPHPDVLKSRSIVGLILLALIWVVMPVLLAKALSFLLHDFGIDNWLSYLSILAYVLPACFVPPYVIYEYAYFRQLQFPFAGALRLPLGEAIEAVERRLSEHSRENAGGWSIQSKEQESNGQNVVSSDMTAVYSGKPGDPGLPLKIYLRLEKLDEQSTFLAYWFSLDWRILFKGRAVSRIKTARYELDRLIKEN